MPRELTTLNSLAMTAGAKRVAAYGVGVGRVRGRAQEQEAVLPATNCMLHSAAYTGRHRPSQLQSGPQVAKLRHSHWASMLHYLPGCTATTGGSSLLQGGPLGAAAAVREAQGTGFLTHGRA